MRHLGARGQELGIYSNVRNYSFCSKVFFFQCFGRNKSRDLIICIYDSDEDDKIC